MTQNEFFDRYSYDLDADYLGGGGFGKVYRAFDDVLDRHVAIKIAEVKKGMEQLSLKKEVELTGQVKKHKNIANYEACFRFRTPHGIFDYGILQFYPEGNLSKLMSKYQLTDLQKTTLAKGIITGLKYLHDHDIVHRDLKSSNVLISKRQDIFIPKIADFGLSKQFVANEQSYFSNSFAGGSILYVAPEQISGEKIRKNVDIWGMGVILFELFTGQLPFYPVKADLNTESARQEIIHQIVSAKLPDAIQTVPDPWQNIIRKSLVVDTGERLKSVDAVAEIIGEKIKSVPVKPLTVPVIDRTEVAIKKTKPPGFDKTKIVQAKPPKTPKIQTPRPLVVDSSTNLNKRNVLLAMVTFLVPTLFQFILFNIVCGDLETCFNPQNYQGMTFEKAVLTGGVSLSGFFLIPFLIFTKKWKHSPYIVSGITIFFYVVFQFLTINSAYFINPLAPAAFFLVCICLILAAYARMQAKTLFVLGISAIVVFVLNYFISNALEVPRMSLFPIGILVILHSIYLAVFAYFYFKIPPEEQEDNSEKVSSRANITTAFLIFAVPFVLIAALNFSSFFSTVGITYMDVTKIHESGGYMNYIGASPYFVTDHLPINVILVINTLLTISFIPFFIFITRFRKWKLHPALIGLITIGVFGTIHFFMSSLYVFRLTLFIPLILLLIGLAVLIKMNYKNIIAVAVVGIIMLLTIFTKEPNDFNVGLILSSILSFGGIYSYFYFKNLDKQLQS